MAKNDLSIVGFNAGNQPRRVAASATRFYVGEPLNMTGTYTSGASNANTVSVMADAKPVIGTDNFVGIAAKDAEVDATATVTAHKTLVTVPIPFVSRIRGKAKSAAAIDTDAELVAILEDFVLFDLTSSVYTIDQAAAADTSGLKIVDGNIYKGTLDVVVDARAMRADIS